MLQPVGKQAYKLEISATWRIYYIFHILLLEQNTTKKGWINKFLLVLEFEAGNNKEYKIEIIQNNSVYAKKANKYLLELCYLVA